MVEFSTQLNFTQIAGQPHEVPEKAIDKLVTFTDIDASTSAEQHLRYFSKHCGAYVKGVDKQEDVYMTTFLYLWMVKLETSMTIFQTMHSLP